MNMQEIIDDNPEKREEAQLYQAMLMRKFKESEEYALIYNTFQALVYRHKQERMKAMKLQSTRENCLYHTGIEDGVFKCLEEIDRIITMGEMIRQKNNMLKEANEGK